MRALARLLHPGSADPKRNVTESTELQESRHSVVCGCGPRPCADIFWLLAKQEIQA